MNDISEHTRIVNLSNERVKNSRDRLAHAIQLIQVANQEMRWACEAMQWADDVCFDIDEALIKLGTSLATLVNWDRDIPVEEV